MAEYDAKGYAEGVRAADKAIAAGVPRWVETDSTGLGALIHCETGLPIAVVSAPLSLQIWNQSFAKGHNDEILAAVQSGAINIDFRPLLMSLDEVRRLLATNCLGTLYEDNPRLSAPDGSFVIELQVDNRKNGRKTRWIGFRLSDGKHWPKLYGYDGPIRVAVGKERRALVIELSHVYFTCDVETTQLLNRYAKHG